MSCVFCGGKTENKNVTFIYEQDDHVSLVQNVPAEVCLQCGEKTYSPEVVDELLLLAQGEQTPQKTVKVPVFDYVGKP